MEKENQKHPVPENKFYPQPMPEWFDPELYWRNHPQKLIQYIDSDTLQQKVMLVFTGKQDY